MKAAVLLGPGKLELQEIPEPELRHSEVLVKVKYAGICGTDYSIYTGKSSFVEKEMVKFPLIMGHEWSGVVEKTGEGVLRLREGDRVVGDTAVSCGRCYECLSGSYLQCADVHPVGTVNAVNGAFADYIVLPERHLFKMHDNVKLRQGALVEPAATAMYAVQRGMVKPGDIVLVHGTGPIGLAAVQLAKLYGAAKVVLSGRKDFKLNLGKDLGADTAVNILTDNLNEAVMDLSRGRGADVIVEASGAESALKESFNMVKPGGTISLVAFYEQHISGVDFDKLVLNDVNLITVGGSPVLGMKVLELMAHGRINLDKMITHEYLFDDIVRAMENMKCNNEKKVKVMLKMDGAGEHLQ